MRLVYVSPVPLGSFAQRPHHFVEWFHRQHGAPVMWVEPGPSRLPRIDDVRRLSGRGRAARRDLGPAWSRAGWVHHVRCAAFPFEPLAWGRVLNRVLHGPTLRAIDDFIEPDTLIVVGKPCALAIDIARRHRGKTLVFDAMDRLSEFFTGVSQRWMRQAEEQLARDARWIMASSTALAQSFPSHAAKVRVVLNGLSPPPAPGVSTPGGRESVVLGYVGTIDRWFDWSAVVRLALDHPACRVDLIGPCGSPPPIPLPVNVRLLPPIPQHRVYEALAGFSVGLIPFERNALTDHVDPVKFYEYRAAGLPVLSARFGEMAHRGRPDGVFFLDDLWRGSVSIEQMIAERPSPLQTSEFIVDHAWERRFEAVDFLQVPGRASAVSQRASVAAPAEHVDAVAAARAAAHWDRWQVRQASAASRFTDWGDHPVVLQEVFSRAFGHPQKGFFEFLAERYPHLSSGHALSLCCGDGQFERGLLQRGVFARITGYEIAAERIAAGLQARAGQAIEFVQADVNRASYGESCFDVVFAKAALHHIEALEHALAQIVRCLKPGGLLVAIDFFGPSRFQWTAAQLEACNTFWATRVPAELRLEPDGHPTPPVERPRIEDLIAMDPSEAVRSSELHGLLRTRFELEHDIPLGGALLNLLLSGDRVNRFDPDNPAHSQVIREAAAHERALMDQGLLGSDFRFVVARPAAAMA